MPETDGSRPIATLLHSLAQDLYLSTACAAGRHGECMPADPYRGLVCCCPVCAHLDLDAIPPAATAPLHHLAEEGREKPGYTYRGQYLGVRSDLYRRLERALACHVHELRRPAVAYDVAVAAALFLAPRRGA